MHWPVTFLKFVIIIITELILQNLAIFFSKKLKFIFLTNAEEFISAGSSSYRLFIWIFCQFKSCIWKKNTFTKIIRILFSRNVDNLAKIRVFFLNLTISGKSICLASDFDLKAMILNTQF